MMKLNRKWTALAVMLLAGSLLAACQTAPAGSPEANRQEAKQTTQQIPEWFLNLPQDDLNIYAAGTSVSTDLQLSMDKATLSAKRTLADQINGHVSSKMKSFMSETGVDTDVQVTSEVERVTTNLISEVNLSGYSQQDAKAVAQDNKYRTYVLLRYPTRSADTLVVKQVKKNQILDSRLRASKAFQELEKDIEAARSGGQ